MAGYSGTPLPRKLGIKPQCRAAFLDLPPEVKAELREVLAGCQIAKAGHGPRDFPSIGLEAGLVDTKVCAGKRGVVRAEVCDPGEGQEVELAARFRG
jgi:hypothetical protein